MTRRWTEQRWLIDNVIRANGVDWDQPRSINYNTPCGPEANADFAAIRERVKKFADISPAFESTGKRREAKAMLREWEKRFPGRVDTVFAALGRVAPSHVLDRSHHDFQAIGRQIDRAAAEPWTEPKV